MASTRLNMRLVRPSLLRGKRIETGFRAQVELVWDNLRFCGVRLYKGTV